MALFQPKYQHFLGYALSGGGAKGFAHLGAFKVFESYGLKPDVIVGTSAGALAGVFYADGFTPDEISELFEKKNMREFIEFSVPKTGFFKNTGLKKLLKDNLRSKTFEDLKIPFMAVATDWEKGRTTVFSEGDLLIDAVVASCSVPIVFTPNIINDVPYVDGGLLKNFPVSVIRKQCKYVIGVNVSLISSLSHKTNIANTSERTFKLMANSNTIIDSALCDILVEVRGVQKYFMFDLNNVNTIKEIGYNSTAEALAAEKAQYVIRRCHRHYLLEEKVKEKINRFK